MLTKETTKIIPKDPSLFQNFKDSQANDVQHR